MEQQHAEKQEQLSLLYDDVSTIDTVRAVVCTSSLQQSIAYTGVARRCAAAGAAAAATAARHRHFHEFREIVIRQRSAASQYQQVLVANVPPLHDDPSINLQAPPTPATVFPETTAQ